MSNLFEYLPYIFASLIIIIILFFTYLRVKYGFWYHQPVHHIYDLRYHFFPPGIIINGLPEKNKYTNFKQIETKWVEKMTKFETNQLTNFIRANFLKNGDNIFAPSKENIIPYFIGFTQPSFISFFREPNILLDTKDKELIEDNKLIGVITGRPLNVHIKSQGDFDVYYIDYLCVHMDYRKKGTAPQLIQTHEYNQRHLNKNINVCLFKREGQMTGIVPICIYDMRCFDTIKCGWRKPSITLHSSYNIVQTGKTNLHLVMDYLKTSINAFEMTIIPETANILELIKTENIYVYFLVKDHNILAIYFFRRSCTYIEDNRMAITLFASINSCQTNDIFIQGFKMAYWEIYKKNNEYTYVVIEDISHSKYITKSLVKSFKPEIVLPAAYFFYNFAYKTFDSQRVLIIN